MVISSNLEDLIAQLTQVSTELRLAEIDLNKSQRDLEGAYKILKLTENELHMTKDNAEKYR